MKSDKNILKDIIRAQGVYVHGDVPEPTADALKLLREYGHSKYREGSDDATYDAGMN